MRNLLNLVFLTVIFVTLSLPSLASKPKRPQTSKSHLDRSYTKAFLTVNDFGRGGDGGDESECDERFHDNSESVVALSTPWFNNKKACGRWIIIFCPTTRKKTRALVVDECDTKHGYDKEHANQPPCKKNIVDGSRAVWSALGINPRKGRVRVQWRYDDIGAANHVKRKQKKKKKRKKHLVD